MNENDRKILKDPKTGIYYISTTTIDPLLINNEKFQPALANILTEKLRELPLITTTEETTLSNENTSEKLRKNKINSESFLNVGGSNEKVIF